MGIFAHATHVFIPEKDTARVVAGALLKSAQSLVVSKPYGKWINVYLEMGLSYKDVLEFPTVPTIELNCYNSEGFDLRLFAQDRLMFMYENGAGDAGDDEAEAMERAAELWEKDNPEAAKAAKEAAATSRSSVAKAKPATDGGAEPGREALGFFGLSEAEQAEYARKAGASADAEEFDEQAIEKAADLWAKENPEMAEAAKKAALDAATAEKQADAEATGDAKALGFWGLPKAEQDKYVAQAREASGESKGAAATHTEEAVPACDAFAPYLPEGRTPSDLHRLLVAMTGRQYGPPQNESDKALLELWMGGRSHSERAEDYVAAIGAFLGVKGSCWSLDAIQEQLADKIERRIVATELLEFMPKG